MSVTLQEILLKFQVAVPLKVVHSTSAPKVVFTSFCVKRVWHIKAVYYFSIFFSCLAVSQNSILAEPRLPTIISKVKFSDFLKYATSHKMQLKEFRFHTNFKVHSIF